MNVCVVTWLVEVGGEGPGPRSLDDMEDDGRGSIGEEMIGEGISFKWSV